MTLVQTPEQFTEALAEIAQADVLALDTETSGLHIYGTREGDDYLMGLCVATAHAEWYFPFRHPVHRESHNLPAEALDALLRELERSGGNPGRTLVFHNAMFDWSVLRREGWSPGDSAWWLRCHDTMTGAWMLDENLPSYRLKDLGTRYLCPSAKDAQDRLKEAMRPHCEDCGGTGTKWLTHAPTRGEPKWHGEPRVVMPDAKGRLRVKACRECDSSNLFGSRTWAEIHAHEIAAYGAGDARLTYDLYVYQRHFLAQDAGMLVNGIRERDILHAFYEMVANGIRIDREAATSGLNDNLARAANLALEFPGVDLHSTPQLVDLLYTSWRLKPPKRTTTGRPSVDAESLRNLADVDERVGRILEWRKCMKAANTYFLPMLRYADRDGRIHPSYKARGTVTGRASCSEPNLQTIPHDWSLPGVRECFIAADGYELWEYDLEQAELRVICEYSGDETLREHLASGDLHTQTALRIFGRADGSFRRMAKNLNFAIPYEASAAKLAQMCRSYGEDGIDEATMRSFMNAHDATYPGIKRASRYAAQVAEERGYVKLWRDGRYRRYRGPTVQWPKYYTSLNSIVQGGVGEIIADLMVRLRVPAQEYGVRLVLQCHDALAYEIPEGLEPLWTPIVRAAAADCNPFTIEMPIGAKPWKPPSEASELAASSESMVPASSTS